MILKPRKHHRDVARYRGIPERVHNAIAAQQKASEKLVGWVQLAVVIFFGLLYAVSPAAWGNELRQKGKPPLKVGAAVATGRIIFGAVGDETRLEYTVIGDAVNLSAKLEKHAKSEGVQALCTLAAFEIATRQGYRPPLSLTQRKSRPVEGVATPVDIVVLVP